MAKDNIPKIMGEKIPHVDTLTQTDPKPVGKLDIAIRLRTPQPDMQLIPCSEGYPLLIPGQAATDKAGQLRPGLYVEVSPEVAAKAAVGLAHATRAKHVLIELVERKGNQETVTPLTVQELQKLVA